ncbi:hypothetical protein BC834DRAFT_852729, partial [Gloeopeniophorella convolvens]
MRIGFRASLCLASCISVITCITRRNAPWHESQEPRLTTSTLRWERTLQRLGCRLC